MKYKIGDKLKVKPECKGACGKCSDIDFDYIKIISFRKDNYFLRNDNYLDEYYQYNAIKNEKVVANCSCYKDEHLIPYTKTIEDIEKGDVIKENDGDCRKVLARLEDLVFVSNWFDKENKLEWDYKPTNRPHSIQELKEEGYTIVDPETLEPFKEDKQEFSNETIEIAGKKYNREAVVERLKELEEIE